jgi:hypothetical protein
MLHLICGKMAAGMKGIFVRAGVAHTLHYLEVPDAECKRRLRLRNASGEHEFSPTEADFEEFTHHFVPPGPEEGFNVITKHFGG